MENEQRNQIISDFPKCSKGKQKRMVAVGRGEGGERYLEEVVRKYLSKEIKFKLKIELKFHMTAHSRATQAHTQVMPEKWLRTE